MKVAILTQPLGHNYGGLLQAYALQTYLEKIGCSVEILDRRYSVSVWKWVKNFNLNLLRLMLGRIKSLNVDGRHTIALQELIEFRKSRLSMSPLVNSEKAVREHYRENYFDAFIVGSDQVWRPKYSPGIRNYYLDFLDDIESPALRLAYAASFGVKDWEYPIGLTRECQKLINKFDAISVRELSGSDLCLEKFDVHAECLVDPTFLLDTEDYDSLIADCSGVQTFKGLLTYVLDPALEKVAIAEIVGAAIGEEIFSIKPEQSAHRVKITELGKCKFPSVESWLAAFRNARYVITDSFHGTVFSILFNKPFIAIGNSARGMARFESLLSQFGLSERLVETYREVSDDLIFSEIDWDKVNFDRKKLAEKGKEFLNKNLLR